MKSDFGIARVTYDNFPSSFCVYKVSFTRLVTDMEEWDSPTMIDSRIPSPNMDAHLKFSVDVATDLELIVMFVYSDSLEIVKDDSSPRNLVLNYPL